MPRVQDEGDFELALLVRQLAELVQQLGRLPDQLIVGALLHLFVEQRVVGGQGGELLGPQFAGLVQAAGVQP